MSIDVEEWHHADLVRKRTTLDRHGSSLEAVKDIVRILDESSATATFFIVGQILRDCPEVGEVVADSGNEIAFHGFDHRPLWEMTPRLFDHEVRTFQCLLEPLGCKAVGYRAPTASLDSRTLWALTVLQKEGFLYDSSIFPAKTPLYGVPLAKSYPHLLDCGIVEFPLLTIGVPPFRIPLGTGFWFRLFPLPVFQFAIRNRNKRGVPAIVSFHTWEYMGDAPNMHMDALSRITFRYNLGECRKRIRRIVSRYRFVSFRNFMEDSKITA